MESPILVKLKENITKNSTSVIENYKIFGNKDVKHLRVITPQKFQTQYEQDPYSQKQNFLYKRAMFGLSVYEPTEVAEMPPIKRKRIHKTHVKTQSLLNLWKQEIMNIKTNSFLAFLFPKGLVTKTFIEETFVDNEFKNTMSFQDLGVSKEMVIDKLIVEKILPPNFYNLK